MGAGWTLAYLPVAQAATNPFAPPAEPERSAPPPPQSPVRLQKLEFRGVVSFDGETKFGIYDGEARQSYWIPLNGAEEGIVVDSFDPAKDELRLSLAGYAGFSKVIQLKASEIVAAPMPVTASAPTGAQGNHKPYVPGYADNKVKKLKYEKDPETLRKEEEARKMVTDMLEAGVRLREARRKEREERLAEMRARQQLRQR